MVLKMYNALARCYLQRANALSLRASAMLLTMYNALARCYKHAVTLLQMALSGHHINVQSKGLYITQDIISVIITSRNKHKSACGYSASKIGVLHDLESAWTFWCHVSYWILRSGFDPRSRQTLVVKPGSDSSIAKLSATGVSVTGPRRLPL